MPLLPQPKYLKGKLQALGSSISNFGDESRTYSFIRIGRQELHNVIVSKELEKLLILDDELEITLCGVRPASFLFSVSGLALMAAGEMMDTEELFVTGGIILSVSLMFLFRALIFAGHEVCSVSPVAATEGNDTVSLASAYIYPAAEEQTTVPPMSEPDIAKAADVADLPPTIRSRVFASVRLTCSNCASEAWVAPDTKILCGPCGQEMRS